MKTILKTISFLGLALTISPSIMHFAGLINFETHKWITTLGTIIYLSTAPFWMNKNKKNAQV